MTATAPSLYSILQHAAAALNAKNFTEHKRVDLCWFAQSHLPITNGQGLVLFHDEDRHGVLVVEPKGKKLRVEWNTFDGKDRGVLVNRTAEAIVAAVVKINPCRIG